MRQTIWLAFLVLLVLSPVVCDAQQVAQVQCARQDGYAYLYSSMTTLEIGATLKCGQQLRIVGRYDNFFEVRTENGQAGFVATSDVKVVRATSAGTASATRSKGKQSSAKGASTKVESAPAPAPEIVLPNQTPVHMKLEKALSSATARVGDEVNFEVTQDVVIRGVTVIRRGAAAIGTVTEAEPKRRMGRGGKLSVRVTYVRVGNTQKVALQSSQEDKAGNQKVGKVVPFMHGKDATLTEQADITGYVNGDIRLKASDLGNARASSTAAAKN
jgi:hypothetical protein